MRESVQLNSAPVLGADLPSSVNLEYTVVETSTYSRISNDNAVNCGPEGEPALHDILGAIASLQRLVAAKQQLVHRGVDSDWDAVSIWTTGDSQALLKAVKLVSALLDPSAIAAPGLDTSRALLKSAVDGTAWIEQLACLAVAVKSTWESLPDRAKQVDHTPLELLCTLGLLLVRLFASAATSASGASQQLADTVLQQICSRSVQVLLQESLAAHLFIFRWHEQPTATADLDAVALSCKQPSSTLPSCDGDNTVPARQHMPPRLLTAEYVPTAHRAWSSSFMLPVLPSAAYWHSGQEVLLGWDAVCQKAEQLGLPVEATPELFMLALEGLWLFTQPASDYLRPSITLQSTGAAQAQLQNLWSTLPLRLIASLEAATTTATTEQTNRADECAQAGITAPAAPVLFGMLSEALQLLQQRWLQEPAAARAALIRSIIADSEQPVIVRQKRMTQLLGKAKPKAEEMHCAQLVLQVKHLALLLTEVLQLERSACGGPARDGTLPATQPGKEVVWFSSLWRFFPRGCCQVLELLLRCPTPPCTATTTLIELLLDDMWEALKVMPLLQERETAKAVTAAVVSSQKLVLVWQAAISDVLLSSSPAAASNGSVAVKGAVTTAAGAVVVAKSRSSGSKPNKKATSKTGGTQAQQYTSQPASTATVAATNDSVEQASRKGGSETTVAETQTGQVPPWLSAAAEADAIAAIMACLKLCHRVMDCAQKAYYWRWYTWWEPQQQQIHAQQQPANAPRTSDSSSGSTDSDVWGSSGSFLSSSCDDSDADMHCSALGDAADAANEGASSTACSCRSTTAKEAAEAANTAQEQAASGVPVTSALWGDGAVQLAFGCTALAAPCFQFVDAIIKRGFANLPEQQRLQHQEATMSLLEDISAGLSANCLILVELNRLQLLPSFAPGATAVVNQFKACLQEMLKHALATSADKETAAAACKGVSKAAAAAAAGAPAGKALLPPAPAAAIDVYEQYWQALAFQAVDQMKVSKMLVGFAQQPVAVAAVGCHNPGCCNISGASERRLVTLACRACRQVAYCSRSCQAAHWKAEGYSHKAECKDLQDAQQAEWLTCNGDYDVEELDTL